MCEVQIVNYKNDDDHSSWRVQLAGYQHQTPIVRMGMYNWDEVKDLANQYARCLGWPIAEYVEHIETVTNLERVGGFE